MSSLYFNHFSCDKSFATDSFDMQSQQNTKCLQEAKNNLKDKREYRVLFEDKAEKELKELSSEDAKRVEDYIQDHLVGIYDPREVSKSRNLVNSYTKRYRYKVSNTLRISVLIDDKARTITIDKVGGKNKNPFKETGRQYDTNKVKEIKPKPIEKKDPELTEIIPDDNAYNLVLCYDDGSKYVFFMKNIISNEAYFQPLLNKELFKTAVIKDKNVFWDNKQAGIFMPLFRIVKNSKKLTEYLDFLEEAMEMSSYPKYERLYEEYLRYYNEPCLKG